MHFQGTPLGGGEPMGEGVVIRVLGRGCGCPARGGYAWALETQFYVAGGI